MRYLVVDDEEASCRGIARRLLRFLPAEDEVLCAFSAEEALVLLREKCADILLTDIRMGEMNGLSLIEAARREKLSDASIILTAYDSFPYAQSAVRLEVKDFLLKPCSEAALRESVQRVTADLLAWRQEHGESITDKLYQALCHGENVDALIRRLPGTPVPVCVRIIRTSAVAPPPWPGKWSFCDDRNNWMLTDESLESLKEWILLAETTGLRAGISPADVCGAESWIKASKALEAAQANDVPALIHDPEMEDIALNPGVAQALYHVLAHIGEPIEMQDVCDRLHINYSYFSRLFKQQMGIPFSDYVLRRQMEWAQQVLQRGKRVGAIAQELGYLNAENFSRAFTRYIGVPPSRISGKS